MSNNSKGKHVRVDIVVNDSDTTDFESDVESTPALDHPFLYSHSPRSPNQNYDAYCVFSGKKIGIFTSWFDVSQSIAGLENARFFGCSTIEDAVNSWKREVARRPEIAERAKRQLRLNQKAPVNDITARMASISLPCTPRKPRSTPSSSTTPVSSFSPAQPASPDDEQAFFVVIRGSTPGVYQGSLASWEAAGPNPLAKRVKKSSELEAWKYFGQLVMANRIQYL